MSSPLKPRDFKRVKLYKGIQLKTLIHLCSCIVWVEVNRKTETDGYWLKGELLCDNFLMVRWWKLQDTLDSLCDKLYNRYLDLFYGVYEE